MPYEAPVEKQRLDVQRGKVARPVAADPGPTVPRGKTRPNFTPQTPPKP
jgi:hypothetical protein